MSASSRAALVTALRLSLGVVVALGFARFAYALLLPAMRDDLEWSYTAAGSLNTANAAGYLLGAALAARLLSGLGARRAFTLGLFVTAAALMATAGPSAAAWLLAARFVAGVGGALTFTAGGVLAAHAASDVAPRRRGQVLSVYYAGGGLGILISGLTLPGALDVLGASGWRLCWLALGALSLAAALLAAPDSGPRPSPAAPTNAAALAKGARLATLWPALVAYSLFALGYLAYMTFSVALLRQEGVSTGGVGVFWSALGLASLSAPLVWGGLLERERGGRALATLLACVSLGAALPLVSPSAGAGVLSAALFGGSFLSVVAATTALVRHHLPPERWAAGVATFTVVFAAFQTLGPLLTGLIADHGGGLRTGLGVSAALLLVGALAALGQRAPR